MKSSKVLVASLCLSAGLVLAGCSNASGTASSTDSPTASATSDTPADTATTPPTGGTCDVTVGDPADAASSDTAPDAEASGAALETVTVSGDADSAPTATYNAPLAITSEVAKVANDGSGAAIEDGQVITFNYMVCDVVTGEKLFSTWGVTAEDNAPMSYTLSPTNFGEVLAGTLSGTKIGAQLLWGQPGLTAQQSYTGAATNGYLYVLTVMDAQTLPDSASGTEVTPSDDSLPAISFVEGVPAVSVPDSFTDPTDLVVQPLIEGDGPVVEAGQSIAVKYTGWLTDGTQFDSSWDKESPDDVAVFSIGTGNVIQGWDQGLVGQKVGSRVLLVVPSALGYPSGSGDTIPPDSTLIFVVDILGAF